MREDINSIQDISRGFLETVFGLHTEMANMSRGEGYKEKHSELRAKYKGEKVSVCPEDLADLCW